LPAAATICALLRDGHSDSEISSALAQLWRARADRYSELRTAQTELPPAERRKVEMSYIGG
jgi:cyclic pyranopterin phosphate synthase